MATVLIFFAFGIVCAAIGCGCGLVIARRRYNADPETFKASQSAVRAPAHRH